MTGQLNEFDYTDSLGARLVRAERQRQIDAEGYTPEHDAEHGRHVLTRAANEYRWARWGWEHPSEFWPWDRAAFKPRDRVSNLIRSGALYIAALDLPEPEPPFWADDKTEHLDRALAAVIAELDAILVASLAAARACDLNKPPGQETS